MWLGVLVEGILNQPWVVGGCRFRVLDDRLGGRVWHVPGAGVGADLGDLGAGMTTGGDGQSVAPDRELVGEKPLAPCLPEQPQPFHRPPRVRFRPGPGWRYTRYIGDCLVPSRPRKRHRHPRGARGRALRAQGQRIWCLCLLSATGPPAVAPTVAPPATWPLQTSSCRYGPTLQGDIRKPVSGRPRRSARPPFVGGRGFSCISRLADSVLPRRRPWSSRATARARARSVTRVLVQDDASP